MSQRPDFEKMRRFSADIRIETVKALAEAGFGHIGGAASIADVLAVLYGGAMNINPKDPAWEDRDWLVLSKGHCGPALYATLGLKGYFPREWLRTVNKPGTRLPSHCDMRRTPGIDMTTGSLGQGLSAAVGITLGNRIKNKNSYTYCILGDGEIQEGQVWEAVQTAAHFKVDHLITFIDSNKKQLDGRIEAICTPFDVEEKFRSFGWSVQTIKGYDIEEIFNAIEKEKTIKERPSVIILDTIKGLGVSFAEQAEFNHYLVIDWDMANEAINEIEKRYEQGTYPRGDFEW